MSIEHSDTLHLYADYMSTEVDNKLILEPREKTTRPTEDLASLKTRGPYLFARTKGHFHAPTSTNAGGGTPRVVSDWMVSAPSKYFLQYLHDKKKTPRLYRA